MKPRWLWFAGVYIAFSLLELLGVLMYAFPYHPETWREWGLLFVLALPIALLSQCVDWGVWRNPLARVVAHRSAHKEFSWLRIAYALVAMLLALAVLSYLFKSLGLEKLLPASWLS